MAQVSRLSSRASGRASLRKAAACDRAVVEHAHGMREVQRAAFVSILPWSNTLSEAARYSGPRSSNAAYGGILAPRRLRGDDAFRVLER